MPSDNLQLWDNNLPRPEELVKILERIFGNLGSEEDMAVLQKVLSILPEQNRMQLGNYIVNIAQENTIHIGDSITY